MLCARGLIVIRVKVDSILLRGFDATSHKEKEFKKKKKRRARSFYTTLQNIAGECWQN